MDPDAVNTRKQKPFKQRYNRGKDFLRYLDSENIRVNGIEKEYLKSLYNNNYTQYRKQIYPDEGRINFSTVLFSLRNSRVIHHQQKLIYLGPSRRSGTPPAVCDDRGGAHNVRPRTECRRSASPKNAPSQPKTAGEPQQQTRNQARRQRQRYRKTAIAVDQHMTVKQAAEAVPEAEVVKDKPLATEKNTYKCQLCKVTCHSAKEYDVHIHGKRHRLKVITTGLHKNKDKMTQDKNGVKLSASIPGILKPTNIDTVVLEVRENGAVDVTFMIENTNSKEPLIFTRCETLKRVRSFSLHDEERVTDGVAKVRMLPAQHYAVTVKTKVNQIGTFHSPIAFQFHHASNPDNSIYIIRFLCLKVTNDIIEDLGPTEEYKRPPRVSGRKDDDVIVIEGVKPARFERDALEKKIPLDAFSVPATVRKLINRGLDDNNIKGLKQAEVLELQTLKTLLEMPLSMDVYEQRFSYLLNLEEIQMEVDIRRYDMEDVTMTKYPGNRKCLLLEVPGLAENRPSVLKGDWLYVRINNNGKLSTQEYKGYVHEVQQKHVALGFNQSLLQQFVSNMKFNVRFNVNRLPLRLQHRAVKLAVELSLGDLIFPTVKTACSRGTILPTSEPLRLFNTKIGSNPEQFQAVHNIVSGTSRPAPYIIFGPPGTGKTVTIVEAMKQIVRCIPTAHILACAPSNNSVDVITERLIEHLPKPQVFRMMASSRPWKAVKTTIKDVCNYDKMSEDYYYPNQEDLMKYKIVVCTLVTAGRIATASFPPGHFTHIFVDEAGCAVEPECMIPLAGVLENLPTVKDGGQLVLAGDPQQLGPIIRSPVAIKHGLRMSLLERYMTQCDVYARRQSGTKDEHYDSRLLTKLVNNYRSHPKILEKSNEMFYHGDLVCKADPLVTNMFCKWPELPKQGFPIIFHGIEGEDMREERSPSFFNPTEACMVLNYVKKLIKGPTKGIKVKESHIGVISPYRKQVQKLRKLFEGQGWKEIKVGTVEEFQGDERLIILLTTVRSQPDFLEIDKEFHLGFLDNPKRFNVAVTRTKSLLIIVGNPWILKRDPNWNSFCEFCIENGGYTGMPYDEENDIDDILQRLSALNIK